MDKDAVDILKAELCFLLVTALGLRGFGHHCGLVALLGQRVVQENDDHREREHDRRHNAVAGRIVAKTGDQLRDDDAGDQTADRRAHAAGGGEGGTFLVVGGHCAEQRAHADVHHRVAALVDDLQDEERDDHRPAAAQTAGNIVERDAAEQHDRDRGENPGAELVAPGLGFLEDKVHQSAHQRVIDGVPSAPDKEHAGQDDRIDRQMHLQIAGHVHGDNVQCDNAAGIAAAVADHVFKRQLRDFGG